MHAKLRHLKICKHQGKKQVRSTEILRRKLLGEYQLKSPQGEIVE